jgi:hypothetical protein
MFSFKKLNFSIALIVLSIFFLHSFAYSFIYFSAKIIIKEITQAAINENDKDELPVTIVFNHQKLKENKYDIIWYDDGEEFKYNSNLYDVKSKLNIGDSVYINCYLDENENLLDLIFVKFCEQTKQDKNHSTSGSIVFLGFYFEEVSKINFNVIASSTPFLITLENKIASFISDIPSPPPRQIA